MSAQLFIVDVVSDDFVLPFFALFWIVQWDYPTRPGIQHEHKAQR